MPAPFKRLDLAQFANLLERFPFTRRINAVHMHHTWRPNHSQFRGHDSIVSMWTHHTKVNRWSDIAQHVTIDPEGFIWLGRNWNTPPASASKQNGNSEAGPFMFEMIGDFDHGRDPFDGPQRATALQVVALVQQRFSLGAGSLMFHNMMSGKTCPGSSIDYRGILAEVEALHRQGPRIARGARSDTFADDTIDDAGLRTVEEAIEDLGRVPSSRLDPDDAQPCGHAGANGMADERDLARGDALSTAQLAALRPHLVNLTMGELSDEGRATTSRGDVDAIFGERLERALTRAQSLGIPLRIVVQVHGGLVDEEAGLAIAQKSVEWWTANEIYPIYFVWETGAFDTIGQLLQRARPRDVFDYTTDPLVQEAVRALQGPRIWGGMKLSARLASEPDAGGIPGNGRAGAPGGAWYVAQQLGAFCARHAGKVELHAVGHSAGAIFLAHFAPRVLELGHVGFTSMHLMAPAIGTALFKATLAPRIDGEEAGIGHLAMYTMRKDYEKDDSCAGVYRKSLLYLIHHALEPQRKTPILGLEECVRDDRELVELFGLGGRPGAADVVWSRTAADAGRGASQSVTHGGFDDDGPTMGSIARRILGRADADRIVEYRTGAGRAGSDPWKVAPAPPSGIALRPGPAPAAPAWVGANGSNGGNGTAHAHGGMPGRRRALCVGINRYPTAPLTGCLADVEAWTLALQRLGFEAPAALLNERATRAAILDHLGQLVDTSRAGDVIVFQYSGHGTQVRDLDGDEDNGDTPGLDEAICPVDFATGALIIDDDIGRIFDRLPDGVNLTCFMDCCHSGTVSRFGVGQHAPHAAGRDERARFIVADAELENAHRRFRAGLDGARGAVRSTRMREVLFAACLSSEVAWESGGQGEFSVRATGVLARLAPTTTNADFARLVTREFGPAPRQQPRLYAGEQAAGLPLLAPLAGNGATAPGVDPQVLVQGMKQLIQMVERPH